jgi:hypothetical protein
VDPVKLEHRLKRVPDLDESTHQAILAKLAAWLDAVPPGTS